MQAGLFFLSAFVTSSTWALPRQRTAPEECPLQNGNLIDTVLFVHNSTMCEVLCSESELCQFYHYFPGSGGNSIDARSQPAQCFLYDECSRRVFKATDKCPINRENTVMVNAFMRTETECEKSCSRDELCGYYLYYPSSDEKQPLMCYHLKSCSPRVIRDQECPLEQNNYIDHMLFTQSSEVCRQRCEDVAGCRFYHWYPIDYSPAPLYCYLFRSCEGGSDELKVSMVAAGRHPGHYFLEQADSLDIVRLGATCTEMIQPNDTAVGRAGAVAEFIQDKVILCGGRDDQNVVRADCLSYSPTSGQWGSGHSEMLRRREEASSVVFNGEMYVMGGFADADTQRRKRSPQLDYGDYSDNTEQAPVLPPEEDDFGGRTKTSERLSITDDGPVWVEGPDLPEARARFCAVALSDDVIAILGGETGDDRASATMKTYSDSGRDWTTQPDMSTRRKDHACVLVEIDDKKGILVTGGVDQNDNLLDSVEFYNLEEETWTQMSSLKVGRTEHGMGVIGGLPAVIGGVSETEFLKSIEVLDNSADEDAPMGYEFRITAHALSRPRYDFAVADIPMSRLPNKRRSQDRCKESEVKRSKGFLRK